MRASIIGGNLITFRAGGPLEQLQQGTSLDSTIPLLFKGTELRRGKGHIFNTANALADLFL